MKSHLLYLILAVALLFERCASLNELQLPPLPGESFISDQIRFRSTKKSSLGCFGYRSYYDSLIKSSSIDSTLTYGIIIPWSSLQLRASERKMRYGDSVRDCLVHYAEIKIQKASQESSLLLDLLFPDNEPAYYDMETTYTNQRLLLTGFFYDKISCDSNRFSFELAGSDTWVDSSMVRGYFICGSDSMLVQPSFKKIDVHGKKSKDLFIMQGFSLMKGDSIQAFLLHAPTVRSGPDVLYLRSSLDKNQQMQISAFFSLISRLSYTGINARIV